MAGHLPVKNTMFRLALLTEAKKVLDTWKTDDFHKVQLDKFSKYKAYNLPVADYNMDDETGLTDDRVIAVERMEDTLEFHLNEAGKINQIYLVM